MSDRLLMVRNTLALEGRIVEGRAVPYMEPATVVEADGTEFEEQFAPRAFASMIAGLKARGYNASAVSLNLDHNVESLDHQVGYATELVERSDGLYATFALYDHPRLPLIRSMIAESHQGLSVGFLSKKSENRDGIVTHRRAHLGHVAVTPVPVYAGAKVTAMREPEKLDDFDPPTPRLDDLRRWLDEVSSS